MVRDLIVFFAWRRRCSGLRLLRRFCRWRWADGKYLPDDYLLRHMCAERASTAWWREREQQECGGIKY